MEELASDFSSFQARSTDVLSLRVTINESFDSLNIRVPAASGASLRVGDIVAKARPFSTNVAD